MKLTNYEKHLKEEKKDLFFRLRLWFAGIRFQKCTDKFESDILTHMFIPKECDATIRKALKKSAKFLIKTDEYKDIGNDFRKVEPEEALLNIFESYLK